MRTLALVCFAALAVAACGTVQTAANEPTTGPTAALVTSPRPTPVATPAPDAAPRILAALTANPASRFHLVLRGHLARGGIVAGDPLIIDGAITAAGRSLSIKGGRDSLGYEETAGRAVLVVPGGRRLSVVADPTDLGTPASYFPDRFVPTVDAGWMATLTPVGPATGGIQHLRADPKALVALALDQSWIEPAGWQLDAWVDAGSGTLRGLRFAGLAGSDPKRDCFAEELSIDGFRLPGTRP